MSSRVSGRLAARAAAGAEAGRSSALATGAPALDERLDPEPILADRLAHRRDEAPHERQVVKADETRAQHLARLEQMAKVGARIVPAGPTRAPGLDGREILGEPCLPEVDRGGPGQRRPGPA